MNQQDGIFFPAFFNFFFPFGIDILLPFSFNYELTGEIIGQVGMSFHR